MRKGELLIELDPTLATADEAQSTQSLRSAQIIKARNDALLAHLRGDPARFVAPEGASPEIVATEEAFVLNAVAQYEAQRSALIQQRPESEAELGATKPEVAKLEEALPFIDKQMSARAELAERRFFSTLKLLEYEQLRAEHLRNIEVQRANLARSEASIRRLDAELLGLRAGFGRTAVTEFAEAESEAGLASAQLRKAARMRQYQELRAPVDGVVQQLAVTTVGRIVQPAQPLMVIVPCCGGASEAASCNAGVTVEAFVQNKDIGSISVGQRVAVKLEAFNFTDYGLIEGTVANISRDAIDQGQGPAASVRDENGQPIHPGLVYAARIDLACGAKDPARHPLCDRVQPGMAVQAEIKTGRRRIIQYLLSPISQALSEAGREK
ncbi:MAG: HlyD family type I secretion periplasmic adaptor subunit [Erythrobacter sp.]